MRPNTVFLIAAILALAFGLSFLLVPGAVLPMYGISPDAPTLLMSRFFGVALVHLGLALYLIREVRDAAAVRALALAGVVGSVCGMLVALQGVLGGGTNALGWSTVAIYGFLLLGYAACLRSEPRLA
jgi:hypothetical protein